MKPPLETSVMAAAAGAAGAFLQIGFGRHAAQLERLGNLLLDGMLERVQFLLRVQKTAGGGILQQLIAVLFKIGDFHAVERLSVVLLFVKRVAFAHHGFVLAARAGIGQKRVNALGGWTPFPAGPRWSGTVRVFFLQFWSA